MVNSFNVESELSNWFFHFMKIFSARSELICTFHFYAILFQKKILMEFTPGVFLIEFMWIQIIFASEELILSVSAKTRVTSISTKSWELFNFLRDRPPVNPWKFLRTRYLHCRKLTGRVKVGTFHLHFIIILWSIFSRNGSNYELAQ